MSSLTIHPPNSYVQSLSLLPSLFLIRHWYWLCFHCLPCFHHRVLLFCLRFGGFHSLKLELKSCSLWCLVLSATLFLLLVWQIRLTCLCFFLEVGCLADCLILSSFKWIHLLFDLLVFFSPRLFFVLSLSKILLLFYCQMNLIYCLLMTSLLKFLLFLRAYRYPRLHLSASNLLSVANWASMRLPPQYVWTWICFLRGLMLLEIF